MRKENTFTRREAMQAMAAVAASAVAPPSAFAAGPAKNAEIGWPGASGQNRERLQGFNEDWRFHRGEIEGAEAAEIGASSTFLTIGASRIFPATGTRALELSGQRRPFLSGRVLSIGT
jgi:hypothetical protein